MADFTDADVAKLKRAIATGARVVKYGERSVEYRSIDEMERALAMMQNDIDVAAGTKRTRYRVGATKKGV